MRGLAATLLALSLAACASTPPLVVALPDPPQALVARRPGENARPIVLLRPVTIPGYLDSYAIVLGRNADVLVLSEDAEWAERLRDGVTRVLRDALSQRVGASAVLLRGEHRAADAELVVEFLRLDPSEGALQLDARWSFVCFEQDRQGHAGRTRLKELLKATTASAVAAATVNALDEFADVLASQAWCDDRQRGSRAMTGARGE